MRVGLFIPCYVDQLFPRVGLSAFALLERHGVEVDYPEAQTCCGQPMANVGCFDDARPLARRFLEIFRPYDAVVCPSGSCTAMVRVHYRDLLEADGHNPGELTGAWSSVADKTYELCEFLHDVLGVRRVEGRFARKVGLHQSCHGLRELRSASASEIVGPSYGKARTLLESLEGIELTTPERSDECCGFGGTFAVAEEAVSCMMGLDRIDDHLRSGAEVITAVDMSCLMHLDGLIRRRRLPLRIAHVAEILAGAADG